MENVSNLYAENDEWKLMKSRKIVLEVKNLSSTLKEWICLCCEHVPLINYETSIFHGIKNGRKQNIQKDGGKNVMKPQED